MFPLALSKETTVPSILLFNRNVGFRKKTLVRQRPKTDLVKFIFCYSLKTKIISMGPKAGRRESNLSLSIYQK